MVVRAPVQRDVSDKQDGSAILVQWGGGALPILVGDTFVGVSLPKHSDHSIHLSGVPGAGGTITLLGSNNNEVSYGAVHDTAGVAISLNAADQIKQILENTVFFRPLLTAGDGTTALVVSMLFHFSNPARQ